MSYFTVGETVGETYIQYGLTMYKYDYKNEFEAEVSPYLIPRVSMLQYEGVSLLHQPNGTDEMLVAKGGVMTRFIPSKSIQEILYSLQQQRGFKGIYTRKINSTVTHYVVLMYLDNSL